MKVFPSQVSPVARRESARVASNIKTVRNSPDLLRAFTLTPRAEENVSQFYDRCVATLRQMPLEVVVPSHLAKDYGELTKQYDRMKLLWSASYDLFDGLTSSEAALILPL